MLSFAEAKYLLQSDSVPTTLLCRYVVQWWDKWYMLYNNALLFEMPLNGCNPVLYGSMIYTVINKLHEHGIKGVNENIYWGNGTLQELNYAISEIQLKVLSLTGKGGSTSDRLNIIKLLFPDTRDEQELCLAYNINKVNFKGYIREYLRNC